MGNSGTMLFVCIYIMRELKLVGYKEQYIERRMAEIHWIFVTVILVC